METITRDLQTARNFTSTLTAPDWTDFDKAHQSNKDVLDGIAENPRLLRALVLAVRSDPTLFAMCEKDEFRFKLVLHTADDPVFRLRLHMWRFGFTDVAHGHRFSYTARLLSGGYRHLIFGTEQNLYPNDVHLIPEEHLSVDHPYVKSRIDVSRIKPTLAFSVDRGQCYSQHHSLLSSTLTAPDTVSVFIRGPAERDCSIQWDIEARTIIWRRGIRHVTPEQQRKVAFTAADFDQVVGRLEQLGII